MTITPKQFNQLATKEDLKEFVTKKYLDKKVDKILNSVDGLAKRFNTIKTESKMDKLAHDRMQKQIDKLEFKTTP